MKQGASDLYITAGMPSLILVDRDIRRINVPEMDHKEEHALIYEIMIGTPAIRNRIREDKVAQMYSAIQADAGSGMHTFDQCLKDLLAKGMVTLEDAKLKAKMPENF